MLEHTAGAGGTIGRSFEKLARVIGSAEAIRGLWYQLRPAGALRPGLEVVSPHRPFFKSSTSVAS